MSLIVIEENRHPQLLSRDAKAAVLNSTSQKAPCMSDGTFLEVISEGEVTRHLEEGVVAGGDTHLFNVQCAHALLN